VRRALLSWTPDLPIAGEPAAVMEIMESYSRWLSAGQIAELFMDAEPGGVLIGAQRLLPILAQPGTLTISGWHSCPGGTGRGP
jgi:hypothetical protein